MGNLDAARTLVVTTVHDEQVVDDMPAGGLTKHDVPVDVIVTPTRVLRVPAGSRAPKPSGVYWDLLSPQKLAQIKVPDDWTVRWLDGVLCVVFVCVCEREREGVGERRWLDGRAPRYLRVCVCCVCV